MKLKLNVGCILLLPFIGIMLIFPITGLVLVILGINSSIKINQETQNYIETTGYYINSIYSTTDDEGTRLYNLQYEYTINGDQYIAETDYLTNNIPNVGSEKKIKYNPDNPTQAIIVGFDSNGMMIITGAGFLLLSSWWMIPMIVKAIKCYKRKIVKSGNNLKKEIDNDNNNPIKTR